MVKSFVINLKISLFSGTTDWNCITWLVVIFVESSPSLWQYIVAGSLTVAAGKYDSRCLVSMLLSLFYIGVRDPGVWWFLSPCSQVNGALAVSIVTTIISLTGAILHGLDTAGLLSYCTGHSMCYQFRVCYFKLTQSTMPMNSHLPNSYVLGNLFHSKDKNV